MAGKYKVSINIEGERETDTSSYRPSVFSVNLETTLPVTVVQKHVNALLTVLTEAAIEVK